MFLEWVAAVRKGTAVGPQASGLTDAVASMFQESAKLLSKCFYCRKCDKACPVDINIHPMVEAFQTIGKVKPRLTPVTLVLHFLAERLMGEDRFKDWTYRLFAVGTCAAAPLFAWLRRLRAIPDWAKTYLSPPRFAFRSYEPSEHGARLASSDNFVVIAPERTPAKVTPLQTGDPDTVHVFIRYRGCMDTYANPAASQTTDTYFRSVLGAAVVAFRSKLTVWQSGRRRAAFYR
jgi:ferredoxin